MKVLLDSCVWGGARQAVAAAGHEVAWVGDWDRDPGDAEILRVAYSTGCILITLDKDFGELNQTHLENRRSDPPLPRPNFARTSPPTPSPS
ncbi:MAG: DUF5615 family PIN-like protein, partial [Myxococcales bacterium]